MDSIDKLHAAAPKLAQALKLSLFWMNVLRDDCASRGLHNITEGIDERIEQAETALREAMIE